MIKSVVLKSLYGNVSCIIEDERGIKQEYIYTDDSEETSQCLAKGSFSREEGFLRGLYLPRNGAWRCFGASVLK